MLDNVFFQVIKIPTFQMAPPSFIPIYDLTEHTSKSCTVIAKVTKVNPVKEYNGKKGAGRRQVITLKDSSGTITMTLFNEPIDKFSSFLQEDQIIEIKNFNCQVSYFNKNKLELTSRDGGALATEIKFATDVDVSSSISKADKFEPIPLSMLPNVAVGTVVDVLGIVVSVEKPTDKKTEAGREVKKCTARIKDASNVEVNVTFWGPVAQTLCWPKYSVVEVHGGRVSSFDMRSISMNGNSTYKVSPETPEASALMEWWKMNQTTDSKPITFQVASLGDVAYRSISYGLKANPSALYCSFSTRVTLTKFLGVLNESVHNFYQSCTQNGCPKKVFPDKERLLCTKCRRHSTDYMYRIRLPIELTDGVTSITTTMFGEVVEKLTGFSTTSLYLIAENEPSLIRGILDRQLGSSYFGEFRHQRASTPTKPTTAESSIGGPSTSKANSTPTTLKTQKITVTNLTPIKENFKLQMQA